MSGHRKLDAIGGAGCKASVETYHPGGGMLGTTYTSCGKCGQMYPLNCAHSCPTIAPSPFAPSPFAPSPFPLQPSPHWTVVPWPQLPAPVSVGWRCPGCSRCHAPHVDSCPDCGKGGAK